MLPSKPVCDHASSLACSSLLRLFFPTPRASANAWPQDMNDAIIGISKQVHINYIILSRNTHTHRYIRTHVCAHTHTHTHRYIRTHVCAHTHTHTHRYIRTHVCAHTHTHTHTLPHTLTHTQIQRLLWQMQSSVVSEAIEGLIMARPGAMAGKEEGKGGSKRVSHTYPVFHFALVSARAGPWVPKHQFPGLDHRFPTGSNPAVALYPGLPSQLFLQLSVKKLRGEGGGLGTR